VAESIESAYKVLPTLTANSNESPQPNTSQTPPPPSSLLSSQCLITSQSQPAIIGISRIWVHHQFRRQGIATALLDSIRNDFIYGVYVKKDQVAVTQPSTEGFLFARRYFGTLEFLVYLPN